MRVEENEVIFKFLITPTPYLNNNDMLLFINHTDTYDFTKENKLELMNILC